MRIYYCSDHKYSIGETIVPFHWNNFIKTLPIGNINVLLECALEFSRQAINNGSVSRLDCVFGFTDSNSAENFAGQTKNIYELKISNDKTPVSFHNYKIISYFLGQLDIKPINFLEEKQLFIDYWTINMGNLNCRSMEIPYVQEIHIQGQVEIIAIF